MLSNRKNKQQQPNEQQPIHIINIKCYENVDKWQKALIELKNMYGRKKFELVCRNINIKMVHL